MNLPLYKTLSDATMFQIEEFIADALMKQDKVGLKYETIGEDPERWRTCNIRILFDKFSDKFVVFNSLRNSLSTPRVTPNTLPEIAETLLDLGNYCFFLYTRIKLDEETHKK